jgi:phosphoglycerol transferase MdoB-like AlkP superfamily enzyme
MNEKTRQPALSVLSWLAACAAVWAVFVASFLAYRLFLLAFFRAEFGPGLRGVDVGRYFATGFRFDAAVSSMWIAPAAALALSLCFRDRIAPVRRALRITIAAFWSLTVPLLIVNTGFIAEYKDQFNHWIFGLVYDDTVAILKTIWKSYPILRLAALAAALAAAGIWLTRRVLRGRTTADGQSRRPTRAQTATIVVLTLAVIVTGIRGSVGRRPVQLKDAAVTADEFLNRLVLNPYTSLRYAIKHQARMNSAKGLRWFLPDGNVRAALARCYPHAADAADLETALMRRSPGAATPARHIFLVLMESYDGYLLWPEYEKYGLTPCLRDLASRGIHAEAFLSAGSGSMPSLSTLMTGLPYSGSMPNYDPALRRALPTSLAAIFKRLGYTTRFFYAGYLSWQRLGAFAVEQAFDEVHGGGEMSPSLTGREWGVTDRELFRFVTAHVPDDRPSLNVIFTCSCHPPFDVDVRAEGYRPTPETVAAGREGSGEDVAGYLGHLWYSDRCVGEFVSRQERSVTQAVFALTGDHWSRRFVRKKPPLFPRRTAPLVLYGPTVLQGRTPKTAPVGSHLDLVPTLIELAAPAGFAYPAFGRDLLAPAGEALGLGNLAVVGADFVLPIEPLVPPETRDGMPYAGMQPADLARLRRWFNDVHALGWWYLKHGTALP